MGPQLRDMTGAIVELPETTRCIAAPPDLHPLSRIAVEVNATDSLGSVAYDTRRNTLGVRMSMVRKLASVDPGIYLVELPGGGWQPCQVVLPPDPAQVRAEQDPGMYDVAGYAWAIRPGNEAARFRRAGEQLMEQEGAAAIMGSELVPYGFAVGEVAPVDSKLAEHLCSRRDRGEHLVVTENPTPPALPAGWLCVYFVPKEPDVIHDDGVRQVFACRPLEPLRIEGAQRWLFGVAC